MDEAAQTWLKENQNYVFAEPDANKQIEHIRRIKRQADYQAQERWDFLYEDNSL